MRRVDKLGRIVIPQSLRKKHGLSEGTAIEIFDSGDCISIKASEALCRICHAEISDSAQIPLCDSCIAEVLKEYK